ncbi:glycosyltransferase involved in cell wall biosynthesis [Algoriphagus sp. 4150]|uniref:glycosyltransferase family 2 protein n=1 Tax=Algoriphagus sp. 4150 TaxID=2817756 RepID=UPI002864CF0C|nr:glycosyltransferase family 2 protein [Algoriphagus sp. 4150]MDR7127723.1 glycosyltransferase involved in cell wall biosynthesis [Algoriphagus sp. 4150]
MNEFKVSVIIPIYNVAEFIEQAVESAVHLPEVAEVLLIDDGSPDHSLEVCMRLKDQYAKISVFQHSEGKNEGISASRNLGIEKSNCDFIAFLDADDWYLPHRFQKDKMIFENYPDVDVAYSCAILEEDLGNAEKRYGIKSDPNPLRGKPQDPMGFYQKKIENQAVLFHTNSITIKTHFLKKGKCFDERLKLHEDSELWNRLMRIGNFYAAEWQNPVAVIRRHSKNSITQRSWMTHIKMIGVQIDNIGLKHLEGFEVNELYTRIWRQKSKNYTNHWIRRGYFYSNYFLNWFFKKKALDRIKNTYAHD